MSARSTTSFSPVRLTAQESTSSSAAVGPVAFVQRPLRITDRRFWLGHVPFVMWLIEEAKPGRIVELGTETGVSLAAMCQAVAALKLPTVVYAVDTWKGDANTGPYAEDVHVDLQSYLNREGYDFVTTLRSTFDDALDQFDDGSIDLLHIDGCHIY